MSLETNQTKALYEEIVQNVHSSYRHPLTDQEAHEAARTLIQFYRVLLEMHAGMEDN